MNDVLGGTASPPVWPVGVLCRAIGQHLDEGFNPISVVGEIAGFSRASSGHCYFTLKDASGQLRCAMFRRAAASLVSLPQDGDLVEVNGRLGVYEARGELQMVVEALQKAGQGKRVCCKQRACLNRRANAHCHCGPVALESLLR
jgi:exodeoxyribonuclease VII large subunit